MTRTIRNSPPLPREAGRIFDVKSDRKRLEAFANKPKPDLSAIYFAALKAQGKEF